MESRTHASHHQARHGCSRRRAHAGARRSGRRRGRGADRAPRRLQADAEGQRATVESDKKLLLSGKVKPANEGSHGGHPEPTQRLEEVGQGGAAEDDARRARSSYRDSPTRSACATTASSSRRPRASSGARASAVKVTVYRWVEPAARSIRGSVRRHLRERGRQINGKNYGPAFVGADLRQRGLRTTGTWSARASGRGPVRQQRPERRPRDRGTSPWSRTAKPLVHRRRSRLAQVRARRRSTSRASSGSAFRWTVDATRRAPPKTAAPRRRSPSPRCSALLSPGSTASECGGRCFGIARHTCRV